MCLLVPGMDTAITTAMGTEGVPPKCLLCHRGYMLATGILLASKKIFCFNAYPSCAELQLQNFRLYA